MQTENSFEQIFISQLQAQGYQANGLKLNLQTALIPQDLTDYLSTSQPQAWNALLKKNSNSIPRTIQELTKVIIQQRLQIPTYDTRTQTYTGGLLSLLHNGITVQGVSFSLFTPAPQTSHNSYLNVLHNSMIWRVVNQVHYSTKNSDKSIDLVLTLNGLPLVTLELKSDLSGQSVTHAQNQYKQDRNPHQDDALLLQPFAGALLHLAVSTSKASMTTKLDGANTRFLPLNTGINNEAWRTENNQDYATSYLTQEVLSPQNLSFLLSTQIRYAFPSLQDALQGKNPSLEFPRYHQLDLVKKIRKTILENGTGSNYLIQHGAGSGKSKEIIDAALMLSELHKDNKPVYSQVVIVTNRSVLDDQISSRAILSSKTDGYVAHIGFERNTYGETTSKSRELLHHLFVARTKVIIVTAQTFSASLEAISEYTNISNLSDLASARAVFIDEGHNGYSGAQKQHLGTILGQVSTSRASDNSRALESISENTSVSTDIHNMDGNIQEVNDTAIITPDTAILLPEVTIEVPHNNFEAPSTTPDKFIKYNPNDKFISGVTTTNETTTNSSNLSDVSDAPLTSPMPHVPRTPDVSITPQNFETIQTPEFTDSGTILDEIITRTQGKSIPLDFFAFTATPNEAALRIFGILNPVNGKYEPFSVYSAQQSRKEGYTVDVLSNYTTYDTTFALDLDPEYYSGEEKVNSAESSSRVTRYIRSSSSRKRQISEIVVREMEEKILPALSGHGKAMMVVSSRQSALEYKQEIENLLQRRANSSQIQRTPELILKPVVAFSGSLYDEASGQDVTEKNPLVNPDLRGRDIAAAFNTENYNLLIVADKFQTGFDQPKLIGMFLDKVMHDGVLYQTVCRANRAYPGKSDTFIYDFVNKKEDILDAFSLFEEDVSLRMEMDITPELLEQVISIIENYEIYTQEEKENCLILLSQRQLAKDSELSLALDSQMNSLLSPIISKMRSEQDEGVFSPVVYLRKYNRMLTFLLASTSTDKIENVERYIELDQFYALLSRIPQEENDVDGVNVQGLRLLDLKVTQGEILMREEVTSRGEIVSEMGMGESFMESDEVTVQDFIDNLNSEHAGSMSSVASFVKELIEVASQTPLSSMACSNSFVHFEESSSVSAQLRSLLRRRGSDKDKAVLRDKKSFDVVRKMMYESLIPNID